jgi:hypothetical protein
MNVRASTHELGRIRSDIGAALRLERDDVAEPIPDSLLVLLKELINPSRVFAQLAERGLVDRDWGVVGSTADGRAIGSDLGEP